MSASKPTYEQLAARVGELEEQLRQYGRNKKISEKNDHWYKELLDNAFDAIFVLDADFNYLEVNKSAERLFGYSRDEFLSMSVFDVIPAEQAPRSKKEFQALKKRGSYEKFIGKMRRKDGSFVDIEVSSSARYDHNGILIGSVDIVRDITERLQVEKELQQLKQQIEYILAATRTGIDVIDEEYNLKYVDPGWQEIYGDFSGRKCFEYFKGRTEVCVDCQVDVAFETKRSIIAEEVLVKENNRPVQVTVIPFQNDQGEWLAAEVHADITERKNIEEALKESEQKYKAITDTATDAIIMIDADGRVTFWNPAAERFFGYTSQEVLGRDLHAMCMPGEAEIDYRKGIKRFSKSGTGPAIGRTLELTGKRKDGSEFPFELSLSALKTKNTWNALGILRDISQRKKVEEELTEYRSNLEGLIRNRTTQLSETNTLLKQKIKQRNEAEKARRASEDKYRRLVENLKEDYFLFSHDKKGIFTSVSSSISNILAYSPEEFLVHYSKYLTPNSVNAAMVEHTGKCLAGLAQPSFEIEMFDKFGNEHWFEISEAPIFDAKENVIGVEGIAHDITTRKRIEKEMIKTQKLESTGILAGGIAHDFNNLLTAIVGNISLAKMYADPESKVTAKLADIERASWRARDLTQQLLTFSKGGSPVTKSESISSMIKDSAWFTLAGSNVKCEFVNIEKLWPVEADEGQICQVIQNIAANADQAMPEGGVLRIRGKNISLNQGKNTLPKGRYVRISFEDTGKGIPEEHLDKIFDPYFTTKQKGSGLGLAICYSIVKNHRGRLSVESEFGKGSVFTIYLPASDQKPHKKGKKKKKEKALRGTGRILLMDDEDIVREIGTEMLTHLGYEASIAKDGDEAVAMYKQAMEKGEPFAAVVMDLTIPGGKGGKEATKEIRALDPKVIAIVSSGYANDEIMANYRKYGFTEIIPKPYKIDDLALILHKVLNNKSKK